MKRRYTVSGYLERCNRLKKALDHPAFTTDVIVGFPGETEADFEATCRVAREVGFAKIHIFSYSPRAGTPAARLQDFVPPAVLEERRNRLRHLEKATALAFQQSLLGRRLEVLVEGVDPRRPGQVQGTSCRYVPVSVRGHAPALLRRLVAVRGKRVESGVIVGEPEPENKPRPREPASMPRTGRLALPMI